MKFFCYFVQYQLKVTIIKDVDTLTNEIICIPQVLQTCDYTYSVIVVSWNSC